MRSSFPILDTDVINSKMAASITDEVLATLGTAPRVPRGGDKVYKDECAYCFGSPESEIGLYVCMNTFIGFCKEHVSRHQLRTGNTVYFHIKSIKTKKPKEESSQPKEKPTRLAIGVEGGFDVDDENQYDIDEQHSVVLLPDFKVIPLPNPDLPLQLQLAVAGIISAESASKQEDIAAWDGEKRFVSKHAESLPQHDNGIKVPPSGWKCAKCDLKDNLWLNFTDGSILCGRKYFDGSGGNNHALEHFNEFRFPLAVKLGTITPNGADVYSYDEDDMVEDPKLAEHLAHFGINMMMMEKTDKTMTELEIDLNTRIAEWDTIQEAGCKLKPLFGPGYTGLRNLGNSCYLNSVMQVLYSIPDFIDRYAKQTEAIFNSAPADIISDFDVQMSKLGHGLTSGKYSVEVQTEESEEKSQDGIAPRMFKSLVGRGHQEFSTNRQQDAQEFLLHLANLIERNSRGLSNPCDSLKFELEERVECTQSKQVRYTRRTDYMLPVPVDLEAATNKDEVAAYEAKKAELKSQGGRGDNCPFEPAPKLKIPFAACLDAFTRTDTVDDFYSTATNTKGIALRSTKLATFPDYLVIQLKKFTLGEDWVPKKLDVSIDMPDELDVSASRGQGLQPGETELPEGEAPEPEPVIDDSIVGMLVDMGFAYEGCRKAVYHTKNSGAEAAMNWVFEHMAETDFAEPLQFGNSKKKQKTEMLVNEDYVAMIENMGFNREQAIKALKATDNNIERAADWIFSHQEELNTPAMETDQVEAGPSQPMCRDGSGKYQLMAFISHMGTSTSSGHYVCHIFKDGRWVIYNDRKVAQSEKPPKDLGYLYFYRRV